MESASTSRFVVVVVCTSYFPSFRISIPLAIKIVFLATPATVDGSDRVRATLELSCDGLFYFFIKKSSSRNYAILLIV